MGAFTFGLVLVVIAGICNASFALPLRRTRAWKWENIWLVYSVFSLLVIPWVLVALFVAHASVLLTSLSLRDCSPALIFGFLWGIAQAGFGVAIEMLGIAVALPVISAIAIVLGSLIPAAVQHPGELLGRLGVILLVSCVLLVGGLALYSRAVRKRDQASATQTTFRGLALCVFVGVIGGFINLGFAFSTTIVHKAEALGNGPLTSTYPVWMLVLAAGFIPNLLYCGYLLLRQRTAKLFSASRSARDWGFALIMAIVWCAATFLYGFSAHYLGEFGVTIGYLMYGACTMFFANLIGWLAGEWREVETRTVETLWAGMALMLCSVGMLLLTR